MAVAVSTNGTLLYASAERQQLAWFDRPGKRLGTVGDPGLYSRTFVFRPTAGKSPSTRVEAGRELWLIDADRGTSRRTTHDSGGGFPRSGLPTNARFCLLATMCGPLPEGRHGSRTGPAPHAFARYNLTDWLRDGRFLLNTRTTVRCRATSGSCPSPRMDTWRWTRAGTVLRTPVNESAGRLAPERSPRWVAYQSNESGRDEVYVQSFPEPRGPHRISADGGSTRVGAGRP